WWFVNYVHIKNVGQVTRPAMYFDIIFQNHTSIGFIINHEAHEETRRVLLNGLLDNWMRCLFASIRFKNFASDVRFHSRDF
ncbi:MAG TPA: hypothetical protein PKD50_16685, partial [Leptospiraceae bacterium]|nr:hypothetical protein [Leptospiraceae bacterium]